MRFDVKAAECPACGGTKKKFINFHTSESNYRENPSSILMNVRCKHSDRDHMHYRCARCSCDWMQFDELVRP